MEKSRIEIEHTLNSTSRNIIWQLIGTAAGLEKWLADSVQIDGDKASKKVVNFLRICLKYGISSGLSVCFVVSWSQTPHDW